MPGRLGGIMCWCEDQAVTHDLVRGYMLQLLEPLTGLLHGDTQIEPLHGMRRPDGHAVIWIAASRIGDAQGYMRPRTDKQGRRGFRTRLYFDDAVDVM